MTTTFISQNLENYVYNDIYICMNTHVCLRLSPARNLDLVTDALRTKGVWASELAHMWSVALTFSQLKPNPSLHRWQQMHWCSASKQTAACCRLQDATISIHIWHVHTVTYIWFCAETTQVSKRCCCRSSCQLDEQLQFYNMLEQIICISTLFRQQICGMVCLSTRFHTGQHSRFVVIFFCSGSPLSCR